jgi:hypothetical protein
MPCTADDVAALVARELAAIEDAAVREGLGAWLTTPGPHVRAWEYGAEGEAYPCWTVAADPARDYGIVYSEHGHGPEFPWGLVTLSQLWYGMDCGWFAHLEDAFADSWLATDLPIHDVVAENQAVGAPVMASSLPMDEAFAIRDGLAARDPGGRYYVVYRSRR